MKWRLPRVRKDGEEIVVPLYQELQAEDPLSDRALEQMLIGVSTRKYPRSLAPVIPELDEFATSKSAVSRRFVARTAAQLEAALSKSLTGEEWAALMIDGIEFHEHVIVIALGIDATGKKHVLSFRQGSTENATLCREMLSAIVARGVPADRSILVAIDGGKGLRKAVNEVFGENAVVQRRQVHKKRNVLDQLPDEMQAQVRSAMNEAYRAVRYETALKMLQNQARVLAKDHPSAAESLREGLQETLTVKKLGPHRCPGEDARDDEPHREREQRREARRRSREVLPQRRDGAALGRHRRARTREEVPEAQGPSADAPARCCSPSSRRGNEECECQTYRVELTWSPPRRVSTACGTTPRPSGATCSG